MPTKDWHLSHERHVELYLTDEQYSRLLKKIKETVNRSDFEVYCYDSTYPGDKYIESNCGLCNDEFTELDTALFSESFPSRKTMKYRKEYHKCPFDLRSMSDEFRSGCFDDCYLFKNQYKGHNLDVIIQMVEETILEAERWQK